MAPCRRLEPGAADNGQPGQGSMASPVPSLGGGKAPFALDFSRIPLWLREGPWSWVAFVYLTAVTVSFAWVLFDDEWSAWVQLQSFPPPSAPSLLPRPVLVSQLCAVYMLGVLAWMIHWIGVWPIVSYTMISWSLLTARHCARGLGVTGFWVEAIKFPSCAGATVTVSVWWLVLTPIIRSSLASGTQRTAFYNFNTSPFLLNVHLLNWALCALDHLLDPRPLIPADLYIAMVFGLCYLVFYLAVLDRNGHHFYIILSPRSRCCFVSYSLLLAIYVAVWRYWPLFEFLKPPS